MLAKRGEHPIWEVRALGEHFAEVGCLPDAGSTPSTSNLRTTAHPIPLAPKNHPAKHLSWQARVFTARIGSTETRFWHEGALAKNANSHSRRSRSRLFAQLHLGKPNFCHENTRQVKVPLRGIALRAYRDEPHIRGD